MAVTVTHTFGNYASATSSIRDEIQEFMESNAMKNVLFLAPGYPYALTVVNNQSKELDRKKIPYNASRDAKNMFIRTEKVNVQIVYMDPVKWTLDLFRKRDAVFGKKELVDKAREKFFAHIINPGTSLSKYIREVHETIEPDAIKPRETYIPEIKNVYFNDPVTVVLWHDGTKTMVKCQEGDWYSKETGLALCIAKKSLGNMPSFNNVFRKWVPEEEEPVKSTKAIEETQKDILTKIRERLKF